MFVKPFKSRPKARTFTFGEFYFQVDCHGATQRHKTKQKRDRKGKADTRFGSGSEEIAQKVGRLFAPFQNRKLF